MDAILLPSLLTGPACDRQGAALMAEGHTMIFRLAVSSAALAAFLAIGSAGAALAAADVKLPATADKGLYCRELLHEVARQLSAGGNPGAGQTLRYYAKNWTAYVRTAKSRDVNAVKDAYVAEVKKDIARKKYRHNDCGAVLN